MPQWAGSCWYYLRFCDPHNDQRFVGEEAERYWMGGEKPGGVDLYVGGTEHAVLHLLYARFWHKVLFDLGYLSKPEPFQRLVNQGIILGEDNQKMSKSRGNIVNPGRRDRPVRRGRISLLRDVYGAARANETVEHARRGRRVAFSCARLALADDREPGGRVGIVRQDSKMSIQTRAQQKITHATIKKVTEDIESLSFNTAISQMMIFVNAFTNAETIPLSAMRTFLVLLNPFAPHLTSELWEKAKRKVSRQCRRHYRTEMAGLR